MFRERFLAIDWGTTNRRVFLIDEGAVLDTERDDRGVKALAPGDYPGEVAAIRRRFGDLPILMAGMVGSTIGWREAPYAAAPAGAADLSAGLLFIDARTAIIPGVALLEDVPGASRRGDVMRGEEVQLIGAVEASMTPRDALLVQPGTHCKWVDMWGGRICRFTTAMTGELFAMLRAHSILRPQLGGSVTLGPAFSQGVADGRRRDLAAALFGIRAMKLMGLRDDSDATSYASGLLIGAEVAARLDDSSHEEVYLLADPMLGELYSAAITANGRDARLIDSHEAFVAGINAIGRLTP